MKPLNLLFLSLAALLAACDDPSPVSTDQPQAVASGRVTTVNQRPVVSAQVVLFDLANLRQGPSQTVQTDANGYFAVAYHPGRAYGLSVYGQGLVPHIVPAFEPSNVGVITMHEAPQRPSAKKRTSTGILGDVDGNGVVDHQDLIWIALYALDNAADVLNTDDTLLGDIDADGAVTFYDAYLVWLYLDDPAHPLLPLGIGLPPLQVNISVPITQLTHHSAEDVVASWSPDGKSLAFTSARKGNKQVYVMDADGQNITRLTYHDAESYEPASWSSDGKRIAFSSLRDGNSEVYAMDADGHNPTRLTYHDAEDTDPTWSPDGRRMAFTSFRAGNSDVYVMDADGHNLVRLTDHDAGDWDPTWSPDGEHIAFTSSREGNYELYVMDADGHNLTRLTYHGADDRHPSWSPDSRHIAFASKRDNNWEVYMIDADGHNLVRLTDHPYQDWSPDWSPDGKHLAFSSFRQGNWNVYLLALPSRM